MSGLRYLCMVAAGVSVHYIFAIAGLLPNARPSLQEMVRFGIDHTFWLNLAFLAVAAALFWLHFGGGERQGDRP